MRKLLVLGFVILTAVAARAEWPSGSAAGTALGVANTFTAAQTFSSMTVTNQQIMGSGATTISTFTASAHTLGSGVTFTNPGTTALSGTVTISGATTHTSTFVLGKSTDTALNRIMTNSASLDYGATAAGACEDLTITVSGAVNGNAVIDGIPNALAATDVNTTFDVFISAANTVDVRRCCTALVGNCSNPAAATVTVTVFQ